MWVRVIKRAFIEGQYRRPGEVFDCPAKSFSPNWGEKVKKGTESKVVEPTGYVPLEIPSLMQKDRTASE